MALAGLLSFLRQTLRTTGDEGRAAADEALRTVYLLIAVAPLGVMALGAIAFFHWDHFEGGFWIYGRYLDGAILPVLAIGLAVFRPDLRFAFASIFVLAAGLVLAAMVPSGIEHDISDTVAFWPQYLSRNAGFFTWMLVGGIAVAAAAKFGQRLVVPTIATSFALGIYHQTICHDWFLTELSARSPLVYTIRSTVPRGTCIGVNPALPSQATLVQTTRYRLHSFYFFDYGYRRMSSSEWLE